MSTKSQTGVDALLEGLALGEAVARWLYMAALREAEDEDEYTLDDPLRFSLEHAGPGRWEAGYRVQQDEVTRWAWKGEGATPANAAVALATQMERLTTQAGPELGKYIRTLKDR